MALFRGLWSVLKTLGRTGVDMCAGCGGRIPSSISLVCIPKCFSSMGSYPKKPMSSYLRFSTEQLPKFKAKHPDAKLSELVRKIAALWRELPEAEKKVYEADFKAEWKAYKEAVSKYKEQLSPSQLMGMEKEARQKRLKKKALVKRREKLKLVNEAWKNLSLEEKQAYIQLAKDDRIRYDNEMKSWEEQMAEVGRSDLIRRNVKRSGDIFEH
ncbi:transcription factor A, mitochondrial isoform X3 [Mus caroli]|uniref:Transcription factor A, mitochondrial isoform X3 n=1 Tax=Mus caroli TaxID=10089 RepID=A0A6P5QIL0_MUSCR|nr:transcription factor A, mitochondrial isoform X3 [Mus caroli]